ncbi:MAG: DUF3098 domain-containing protein [Muribaculaceae bacterium]|jgi:uncharacterized membrane protein|nr:DUF3098 domain-containing protein [Muribaculaceae bacterium]MEE1337617.1 DUF3098 domain-containing protein [Muribaculaceae bacterium]
MAINNDKNGKKTSINYNAFPLAPANFIRMAVALVLIVLGFVLMAGGANDGEVFNSDIFSTRRIVVGPTISFIGFVYMAFAINYKNKKKNQTEKED